MERVTLSSALAAGDLEPFIRQAGADGGPSVDRATFERRLGALIKAPVPVDQASRSHAPGGSRGK
jgi:hypothetical protein